MSDINWYVVHTYSGYENKVKSNIEKTVENRHLEDQIVAVDVPMEDVQETKTVMKDNVPHTVTRTVKRKLFPGYVLVNMEMNDETWYVVRNTRGVTGFVGPGSKPVPLTEAEMRKMGIARESEGEETAPQTKYDVDFEPGDIVSVTAGAWYGTEGAVQSVNPQKQTVTINVDLFGRDTPVEIGFSEVSKK